MNIIIISQRNLTRIYYIKYIIRNFRKIKQQIKKKTYVVK